MSKAEKEAIRKLNEATKAFNTAYKELEEVKSRKKVKCLGWNKHAFATKAPSGGCGTQLSVKKLTYIQTHWWDDDTGSPAGGFHREGEGQFICPKCGKKNRLYERPDVVALKKFFKEVVDQYER